MTVVQKIAVVFVGSGLVGALSYSATIYPNSAGVLVAVTTAIAAITASLTGFTPRSE